LDDLGHGPPATPLTGRQVLYFLEAVLEELEDDDGVDPHTPDTPESLAILAAREEITLDDFDFPGVPADVAVEDFPGWTVALAREAFRTIAASRDLALDALAARVRATATLRLRETEAVLRRAEAVARRLRRERMLAPPQVTDRIVKYEAHLHR